MAKPGDIIDVKEAAKLLGVKHRQALNLINDGTLPATRMGRFFVVRRADLDKVPKDRKPGPKPKGKK